MFNLNMTGLLAFKCWHIHLKCDVITSNKTHFASRARAMTPDTIGAAALVPPNLSWHFPPGSVVT